MRGCSGIKGAAIPNAIDFTTAAALATADPPRCKLSATWWPPSTRLPSLFRAAGGVGSYASQIAKNLGARVTALPPAETLNTSIIGVEDLLITSVSVLKAKRLEWTL